MYFTRFCMHSQMCIFHEKIITFLFVTLSHMIGFSSNFPEDVKYNYLTEYLHLNTQWHRSHGFFFKTWNFHCTRTSKNGKIHELFEFLVLSSYFFLRVKSCVQHVFAGLKVLRCWKCTFFDDLESKTVFYGKIYTLLFVTLSHIRIEFNFFAKDVKYN